MVNFGLLSQRATVCDVLLVMEAKINVHTWTLDVFASWREIGIERKYVSSLSSEEGFLREGLIIVVDGSN